MRVDRACLPLDPLGRVTCVTLRRASTGEGLVRRAYPNKAFPSPLTYKTHYRSLGYTRGYTYPERTEGFRAVCAGHTSGPGGARTRDRRIMRLLVRYTGAQVSERSRRSGARNRCTVRPSPA